MSGKLEENKGFRMKKRGWYSNEYKQEVLRLAEEGDRTTTDLERELGLSAGLIRKWQQRYRVNEENSELERSEASEAAAEIRRLKRELAIAREERDILKKAIQVFTQDPKP